ncbi:hypothetical protein QZH41_003345 [Actinostola sp. cb2023]|nr:hypothetical protein QZH41_003345 [Actinostola sp. cb2023]
MSDFLLNDGYITANGGNGAASTGAGGGSGGSVLLKIKQDLTGTGIISADGGSADGAGGCGAGGRIAIHVQTKFNYRGKIQALGGISINNKMSGGPEVSSLPRGAGAGHGSSGGRGIGGLGGSYHGSLLKPKDSGRRGGYGVINVNGGNGGGKDAGGGAAGRIALDTATQAYKGLILAQGGVSEGGQSGSISTYPYGDIFKPSQYGTRGCPGTSPGGEAGGKIFFDIGDHLYLDGIIQANGNKAPTNSNAGGGSGGSVLIKSGRFSGHGKIAVDGGSGNGVTSGGGSGGRLAVYTGTENKFLGEYSGIGGSAGDANKKLTEFSGGPGTVYLRDMRKGYPFTQLRIDNKGRPWSHYVTLDNINARYEFDEVHLVRSASVHMASDNTTRSITIHKMIGDRTGTETNFKLDRYSEAVMATTVHIVGLGPVAFDWDEYGSGTVIDYPEPMGVHFTVGLLDIKFNCRFTGEYFEFDATDFYLEPDALLSCKGRGFTDNTNGSGIASSTGGSGAGHGTPGGDSASNPGGKVYGSIYEPNLPGARGGAVLSTLGSRGGGRIRINVGYALVLDGNLNADAENALANTGTGAGSGGSVWIKTGYLRGHGSISTRGGVGSTSGAVQGGSGSGGRIAVHISITDEYRGGFHALGGVSPGAKHGGSGTVYIEEIDGRKLRKRLYINNQNANPPKVFVMDQRNPKTIASNGVEENSADYGFDELMLQGQAVFTIASSRSKPSISVHTILGDGTSTLHIKQNQVFYIEYEEATQRRSFPKVNFQVDYGGEVVLVSDFHISGLKNPALILNGRITGVSNLTLTEAALRLGRCYEVLDRELVTEEKEAQVPQLLVVRDMGHISILCILVVVEEGQMEVVEGAQFSGGGSGGSILIKTTSFSGHGVITTEGGSGNGNGGGGSGGRIAVHVSWLREYAGKYIAYGGLGTKAGAAGTVYYTDTNEGLSHRPIIKSDGNKTEFGVGFTKLIIDNVNRNPSIPTIIINENKTYYEFKELEVNNHAVLNIHGEEAVLVVHNFTGDRTGLVHLKSGQKMFVEVVESSKGYTVASVSYKVDQGAEIVYPSSLTLLGTRCTFEGFVVGVYRLIAAEGARVVFTSSTQTGIKENGTFQVLTTPGNVTFPEIYMQRGSKLDLSRINGTLTLTALIFRVKYHAVVNMNHGNIDSSWAWLESRGKILLEGTGYSAESGPGKGKTVNTIGTGAGHGGEGGAHQSNITGGEPYGSVYKPLHFGSGGGNGQGQGGSGGGLLHWRIGQQIELDGLLSVRGSVGLGTNSGGGSGGTLLIECTNLTGYGEVNSQGGDGLNLGSGGAGGRIAVHVRFKHKFAGTYKVYGGLGKSVAAAGTVYVEETSRGPQYADLKYDKSTNKTIVTATHRYLEVDNANRKTIWNTMLLEREHVFYELDELFLTRHANLQVRHPPGASNVTVIVHRFLGDGTGRFHLRRNQRIFVEVVESKTNETLAPCSFKIDEGSEIIFPSIVKLYGSRSIFEGRITGVIDLFVASGGKCEFSSTSQTAIIENRRYIHIDINGNFTFGTVTIERNSEIAFSRVTFDLRLNCAEIRIKYEGKAFINHGTIDSSFAWIESEGLLSLKGKGFGPETGIGRGSTNNQIGSGAGHGGEGGKTDHSDGGVPYDSVYEPTQFGSGGGNGQGTGGSGGGKLFWFVAKRLQINGLLSSDGINGIGNHAGGGSGGSIFIQTTNMTGHGEISVKGGSGTGDGGGGSGGRVAIHCRWRYTYGGKFTDLGGQGSKYGGPAGTVYKEENLRPLEYRHVKYSKTKNTTLLAVDHTYVHIDNDGYKVPGATMLMAENTTYYEFDEMELTGFSRLLLYHPGNEKIQAVVHRFIGDKSGQFHLRNNQRIFVEVVESTSNMTEAPCSYRVDVGAEILLPSEFHMHGTRSRLEGMITGVHHLKVSEGAVADIYSTTQTALIENRTYVYISEKGNVSFATIVVKRGGDIEFRKVNEFLKVTSNELSIKYQGIFHMNHGEVLSSFAWLDSQGHFKLDFGGYPAEKGPGAGTTALRNGNTVGTGAGYGGEGARNGGVSHGSVFRPLLLGSGGGNGQGVGGSGGGQLYWEVAKRLELNGLVSARGNKSSGSNSGGGSGGSILIEVTNITGHGEISVVGGDSMGNSGAGAGGRIAVLCRWRYTFGGKISDRGGIGRDNSSSAPAGTLYKEENLRPLEYRHLKYLPGTNVTLLAVDHTYLHVDNEGRNVPGATVIMEERTADYEFDEMELTGYSRVVIYHPNNATKITVIAHRFIGDRTGQFHLRNKQKVFVEVVESETNRTEAPCSYLIDQGAEFVLPAEFHVHGVRTVVHGRMTGVHFLFIEDSAVLTVTSTAQTALVENRTYVEITKPGNSSFAHAIIKRGGFLNLMRVSDTVVSLTTALFEIQYLGTIRMNHGVISSTFGHIETKGSLNLDGLGHKAQTGPGAGTNVGYGTGAGHGGQGGINAKGTLGGKAYGSVFTPTNVGSGGGGPNGGSGGGCLLLRTSKLLHLDGLISASGHSATSLSGGGSGGSVLIETTNMTGHGDVAANGGNGNLDGGGGAGGRIGVHVDFRNNYGGTFRSVGGSGSNSVKYAGAAGTVYKYESRRGPQYRELKYNQNISYFKPEHSKLKVDNEHVVVNTPTVVLEEDTVFYEFDEMQVEGHSTVTFFHPAGAKNVTVIAHEVTGDKTGIIRLSSRQRLFVFVVESTHTYMDAPCGFYVDEFAEIVFPREVVLRGEISVIKGRMTGVESLIIERRGSIEFSASAHTALLPNETQWHKDNPFYPFTPGLLNIPIAIVTNTGVMKLASTPGNANGGGGSGGTVIVETLYLKGYGTIECHGGVITSLGGNSVTSSHGGPGTVYVETTIGNTTNRFLQIDNAGRSEALQVRLSEASSEVYYFDEVKLLRKGVLAAQQVLDLVEVSVEMLVALDTVERVELGIAEVVGLAAHLVGQNTRNHAPLVNQAVGQVRLVVG